MTKQVIITRLLVPIVQIGSKRKRKLIWSMGKGWAQDFYIKQSFRYPNLYEPITKSKMFATIEFDKYSGPLSGILHITLKKSKNKLFKIVKRSTKAILETPFLLTIRDGRKHEYHLIKLRTYKKRRSTKSRIYLTGVSFDELDNIEFLKLIEITRVRFEKKRK